MPCAIVLMVALIISNTHDIIKHIYKPQDNSPRMVLVCCVIIVLAVCGLNAILKVY